jgi:hypothetical protein
VRVETLKENGESGNGERVDQKSENQKSQADSEKLRRWSLALPEELRNGDCSLTLRRHTIIMKTLLISAAIVVISLGFSKPLAAETVEYPEKHSAFSIEVPEGWTAKTNGRGALIIQKEDATAVMIFAAVPKVKDEESAKAYVPAQEKATAKVAELSDMTEVIPVTKMPLNGKIDAVGAKYEGKFSDGSPCVYTVGIFTPEGSAYYSMEINCKGEAVAATEKERHAMIESITPANGEDEE